MTAQHYKPAAQLSVFSHLDDGSRIEGFCFRADAVLTFEALKKRKLQERRLQDENRLLAVQEEETCK